MMNIEKPLFSTQDCCVKKTNLFLSYKNYKLCVINI